MMDGDFPLGDPHGATPTTLKSHILRLLRQAILSGRYPPGSRLNESQLAREFEQRCGLDVVYRNGLGDAELPAASAVALFRIVQEALTNIERHARASTVHIDLAAGPLGVELAVRDDGVGFNPRKIEQLPGGIGLRNIRERVEHLGGQFSLSSNSGHTGICVLLPAPALPASAPTPAT